MTSGTGSLNLPAVLDTAQQQALGLIAAGLTQLMALIDAKGAPTGLPADALFQTAMAGDAVLTGGRAFLDALMSKQGRYGADPSAPLQALLQGMHAHGADRLEDFCSLELPWAMATALAQVPPTVASRLLQLVSDDLQDKVVILLGVMTQAGSAGTAVPPDPRFLLEILRALPEAAAERITLSIEQLVPALSDALYQVAFDGAELLGLPDAALQRLIPALPHQDWGQLLKYAAPAVRERVFRNVTRRVAQVLRDEMDMARPIGLTSLVSLQHRLQMAIADLSA